MISLREVRIKIVQMPRIRSTRCCTKTISLITCYLKKKKDEKQADKKNYKQADNKKDKQNKSSLDWFISLHIFVTAIILKHEKESLEEERN